MNAPRGFSKLLIEAGLEYARKNNAVQYCVFQPLTVMRGILAKHGFHEDGNFFTRSLDGVHREGVCKTFNDRFE